MTPYEIAKTYVGTTEGPGPLDNPVVMAMYASVGHGQIEHDSVAWCAAFVGHCLQQAGLRSTRKLTARSYLAWGHPVELDAAQAGDIVVFRRGTSLWQGHVGFFVRRAGTMIEVLGGNQGDAVNIRRYSVSKLLGVRRVSETDARLAPPLSGLSITQVQGKLRRLGYHEVGRADGILGSRTRGAILAFRADHGLPLEPVIDVALSGALRAAAPRVVAPARAGGTPEGSRIVAASNAQIGLGVVGAAGTLAAQIAPAVEQAGEAQGLAARMLALFGLDGTLSAVLPWIAALIFVAVMVCALRARAARIEDHRSGRTL